MDQSTRRVAAPPGAVYATYLDAHRAASRRRADDAANDLVSKVVRSPYGPGYVVRSWPVELFAEPELRAVAGAKPFYTDL